MTNLLVDWVLHLVASCCMLMVAGGISPSMKALCCLLLQKCLVLSAWLHKFLCVGIDNHLVNDKWTGLDHSCIIICLLSYLDSHLYVAMSRRCGHEKRWTCFFLTHLTYSTHNMYRSPTFLAACLVPIFKLLRMWLLNIEVFLITLILRLRAFRCWIVFVMQLAHVITRHLLPSIGSNMVHCNEIELNMQHNKRLGMTHT